MGKVRVSPFTPKSKGGRRRWRRTLLLSAAVALALETAFTFIPAKSLPEFIRPLHARLLGLRNSVVARSGLPISRYDDRAVVETEGGPPLQIFFAPSPKISGELCKFISSAKSSLDVCIYDLDLYDVSKALVAGKQRGVEVRVVTDSDNFMLAAVESLKDAGIKVKPDKRPAIMHNKFVVADSSRVWTGSFNFTRNGALKNDNNALIVESPETAKSYSAKFNEYWSGRFGPDAAQMTSCPKAFLGKTEIDTAFSPSDGVRAKIIEELDKAGTSVSLMAFSFTSKEIAAKLKELAGRGVSVRCLFDNGQAENSYSKDEFLKRSGIRVKESPNRSGKMHHKVIVIDGKTLITGSYNFSNNAEFNNDENIMIIRSPAAAAKFEEEFDRCWSGVKGY